MWGVQGSKVDRGSRESLASLGSRVSARSAMANGMTSEPTCPSWPCFGDATTRWRGPRARRRGLTSEPMEQVFSKLLSSSDVTLHVFRNSMPHLAEARK